MLDSIRGNRIDYRGNFVCLYICVDVHVILYFDPHIFAFAWSQPRLISH